MMKPLRKFHRKSCKCNTNSIWQCQRRVLRHLPSVQKNLREIHRSRFYTQEGSFMDELGLSRSEQNSIYSFANVINFTTRFEWPNKFWKFNTCYSTLETLVNVATVDVFICATEKNIVDMQEWIARYWMLVYANVDLWFFNTIYYHRYSHCILILILFFFFFFNKAVLYSLAI